MNIKKRLLCIDFLKNLNSSHTGKVEFNSHTNVLKNFLKLNIGDLYSQDKKENFYNNQYLNKLRLKIFPILYKKLNKFHKINNNSKYWEVIMTPWLIYFLDKTFHKYQVLEEIIKKNKDLLYVYDYNNKKPIIPTNYEMLDDIYNSNEWDYLINIELIKNIFNKKVKKINKKNFFLKI